MATATATISLPKTKGGAFLIEERLPNEIFTPEDLTPEHLAIARTVDEFWAKEVGPNVDAIQHHEPGVAMACLRKAAELGLTGITIPEQYGGMELDMASAMVAVEHMAGDGSFAGWYGAHVGIGSLPILYFGTEAQKKHYLPKLASMEMLGAYALTEPHAGSDALAAKTRADLSPDGKHYILNGQKMWITNGGHADLFTVFAKIGARNSRHSWSSANSRASPPAPKRRRWASKAAPPPPSISITCPCPSKTCSAKSAAAISSPSTSSMSAG